MVVINRSIDKIRVLRRTQVPGQGVGDDPVHRLYARKRIGDIGAQRGLKRVVSRPAGGEEHLVHAEIRVLSCEGRARAGDSRRRDSRRNQDR